MSTPGTRNNWGVTALGTRTVPVLLVAGINALFCPEGMTLTSVSLSGTVDSAWWLGASASLAGIAKPWLSLARGIQWSERARPTEAQSLDVGTIELTLSDVGGEATALFAQRDAVLGTPITSEISPTATTINVTDTSAWAASGVLYIGREAITYSGLGGGGTTFTGCTRGAYGSFACRHLYSALSGGGINTEVPEVSDGPADMIARPATLWMCTVSAAGVITAAELEYFGHIQSDVELASDGDAWVIRIAHAVNKIGAPMRSASVMVGGYSHIGNRGVTAMNPTISAGSSVLPPFGTCPLLVNISPDTSSTLYRAALSDEAGDPNSGGWHVDRSSFLGAFQRALTGILSGGDLVSVSLDSSQRLKVSWTGSTAQNVIFLAPWMADFAASEGDPGTSREALSPVPMPLSWVPVTVDSRIYLTPGDYANIPAVPSNPISGVPGVVSIYYMLGFGGNDERGVITPYAKITANTSGGGVYYLTCTALDTTDIPIVPSPPGIPVPIGTNLNERGFVITSPTPARLALRIQCNNWIDGIQALIATLDTDAGDGLSEAFDWDDMRRVLARFAPAFQTFRFFTFDLSSTPLAWLMNECALNGYALTLRRGRITLVRVAEFALTEANDGAVTSIDLTVGAAVPGYTRGTEPIVNRFSLLWPASKYSINVFDSTSLALYGYQRVGIEANVPSGAIPNDATPAAIYTAATALGMTTLGPHRRPAEVIDTSLSLAAFGFQLGDLVDVTLWRVPNQNRTRGVTHAVGQVVGRELVAYGDQNAGTTRLSIRLSPSGLAGWAPSIVVTASGISGAIVTAEASPFGGTSGCAPEGESPTYGFAVGDKVRMVEIGNASPTTATQHEITALSATTMTLSPSPNATFAALAASTYKVIVVPDDYDTSGLQSGQQRYAYLAPRATLILAVGARAQKYAA